MPRVFFEQVSSRIPSLFLLAFGALALSSAAAPAAGAGPQRSPTLAGRLSFTSHGRDLGLQGDLYATIDPTLIWNTFLGGSDYDEGMGIAVDESGNTYVSGRSAVAWQGINPPVRGYSGNYDAFVAKLNRAGALVWSTFLGGANFDEGTAIAVDAYENVYVVGRSHATWESPVRAFGGNVDTFAAKLSPSGGLIWNTFLGGGGYEYGSAVAIDGSGNVYVSGRGTATWQGSNPPVRGYSFSYDAFAAKLSPSGELLWNTFLGGDGTDSGYGIAVDKIGNAYVAGHSNVAWGSPVRGYGGQADALAVKLNASTGELVWNTFLGGSGYEYANGLAIDASGNLYIVGMSDATWQGTNPPIRGYSGDSDGFAARLSSAGELSWNTFLGGSGSDVGYQIAADGDGNAYVAGYSSGEWQGTTPPMRAFGGLDDGFVVRIDSSGVLTWSTFLGGSGYDYSYAIAVDGKGNMYVAGATDVTWGSPVRGYTDGGDAFVAKIDPAPLRLPLLMR